MDRADDEIDLARAALTLARNEYPDLDVERYLARLDQLADTLRERIDPQAEAVENLLSLSMFLAHEQGYTGNVDNYYDDRNSFLNEVMDHKLGIPITLSIIYMEVGRRVGLPLHGVGFPGHFMVKYCNGDEDIILDPFNDGALLGSEDLQERLQQSYGSKAEPTLLKRLLTVQDKRNILHRMLRNLKGVYLHQEDYTSALWVCNHAVLLAPLDAEEYRDRGTVHQALDCGNAAIADYREYLRLETDAEDAAEIQEIITELEQFAPTVH